MGTLSEARKGYFAVKSLLNVIESLICGNDVCNRGSRIPCSDISIKLPTIGVDNPRPTIAVFFRMKLESKIIYDGCKTHLMVHRAVQTTFLDMRRFEGVA